jgi:hypothetical protein
MKRQEHTVNSKRHVSPSVLYTDCCGESINAAATPPICNVISSAFHRKFFGNFFKKVIDFDLDIFWPDLDPPQYPSGGVLGTACGCDCRGFIFQVEWTTCLTSCHLSSDFFLWFEDGPEARVKSQLDKRNLSSSSWILVFGLQCRHAASDSITPETHTSGAQ